MKNLTQITANGVDFRINPEATVDTLGCVKLGSVNNDEYTPLTIIPSGKGTGTGIKIDSSVFKNTNYGLNLKYNDSLTENNGLSVRLGTGFSNTNAMLTIPCILGSVASSDDSRWDSPSVGIPYNREQFCLKSNGLNLVDGIASGVTKVNWNANSNMNDFKTAGVYEIYGERTRQDDNLPILNASSGHSIAARLTVVASTLQPANNEICITQFLMISNRKGGDGNMYVRTYNENNSPAPDWWTPWQKLQGIREGYIFTDSIQVNPDGGTQQIAGVTGLNNMIDNGIYTGIYTDDPSFTSPTFIDTFTLIVINNYAVAGKDERLTRTISQLKYAVDALTNQATVKIRTKKDSDTTWSDWSDIGGGTQEVDVTDAVKAYGLMVLNHQGLVKEDVKYKALMTHSDIQNFNGILFDATNKVKEHILSKSFGSASVFKINLTKTTLFETSYFILDVFEANTERVRHFKYTINKNLNKVNVSADMTEL